MTIEVAISNLTDAEVEAEARRRERVGCIEEARRMRTEAWLTRALDPVVVGLIEEGRP
jgi:hypothetical protein